jgi:hypothetical protein
VLGLELLSEFEKVCSASLEWIHLLKQVIEADTLRRGAAKLRKQ